MTLRLNSRRRYIIQFLFIGFPPSAADTQKKRALKDKYSAPPQPFWSSGVKTLMAPLVGVTCVDDPYAVVAQVVLSAAAAKRLISVSIRSQAIQHLLQTDPLKVTIH